MRALITGITEQDGSYMTELLLDKGYEVFGLFRRSSVKKFDRIEGLLHRVELMDGDLTDQSSLDSAMHKPCSRTRCTTWRHRASCQFHGSSEY